MSSDFPNLKTGVFLGQASCMAADAYLSVALTVLWLEAVDVDVAEEFALSIETLSALADLLIKAADDYGRWEVTRRSVRECSGPTPNNTERRAPLYPKT